MVSRFKQPVSFLLVLAAFLALLSNYRILTPPPDNAPVSSSSKEADPKPSSLEDLKTARGQPWAVAHRNCLVKCPSGTAPDNILVDHDVIVLSSNRKTKFADWVAYKVTKTALGGPKRKRNWAKDPQISLEYTFTPQDYQGMGQKPYFFDRGHQAPLASFKNHPKGYVLNYLSNITPQKKDLNRGPWKNLESAERKLVAHYGTAYVLTGPYYDQKDLIPGPPVKRMTYTVPSGYWKIIAVREGERIQAVSFMLSQKASLREDYCRHIVSVLDIGKVTGLRFFDGKPIFSELALRERMGCGLQGERPRPSSGRK